MYKVVIFSNLRTVPSTFAKRYRLRIYKGRTSTAFRQFSNLSAAQEFASSLLEHIPLDLFVYLSDDKHDLLCIYQVGL